MKAVCVQVETTLGDQIMHHVLASNWWNTECADRSCTAKPALQARVGGCLMMGDCNVGSTSYG